MKGKPCFMLRASDFPPNKKNQTAQAFRKFREGGGRSLLVPIPEWERMMTVREFHAHHRSDPGFAAVARQAPSCCRACRLDHPAAAPRSARPAARAARLVRTARTAEAAAKRRSKPRHRRAAPCAGCDLPMELSDRDAGAERASRPRTRSSCRSSVILDENGADGSSILAGREIGARGQARSRSTRTC